MFVSLCQPERKVGSLLFAARYVDDPKRAPGDFENAGSLACKSLEMSCAEPSAEAAWRWSGFGNFRECTRTRRQGFEWISMLALVLEEIDSG